MKKLLLVALTSLISLSTFARSDMEADARELARDRAEARDRVEARAAAAQGVYLRDTLVKLSANDPTLESTLRGLSAEDRKKIIEANAVIYNAVVGARMRGTKTQ